MAPTQLLSAVVSTMLLLGAGSAVSAAESAGRQAGQGLVSIKGARLFAVPVLEPGKNAWVSAFAANGRPLASATILVNGQPYQTDRLGQCSFVVPREESLCITLSDGEGGSAAKTTYSISKGGLLVAGDETSSLFDRLDKLPNPLETAPVISYAPALLETRQPFVIVGKNFSGKVDGDHISIDGYEADTFAGSAVAILATAPRRLDLGPLRELFVNADGLSSNTVEVDICRLAVTKYDDVKAGLPNAKVRVVGTNLPALVAMERPAELPVRYEGKELGVLSNFVTPGGEDNSVCLTISFQTPQPRPATAAGAGPTKGAEPELETHLVADAPWSPDDKSVFADQEMRRLIVDLTKAQIVRLKRRLLSLDSRIADRSDALNHAYEKGMKPSENERSTAELRTLTVRQRRMTSMLAARHDLFLALGGNDEDYRLALDQAAGGAYISLEKLLETSGVKAEKSLLVKTDLLPGAQLAAADADLTQKISFANMTKLWKSFPTKPPRNARLSAPPAPYAPDISQLGPPANTFDMAQYLRSSKEPVARRPSKHGHSRTRHRSKRTRRH